MQVLPEPELRGLGRAQQLVLDLLEQLLGPVRLVVLLERLVVGLLVAYFFPCLFLVTTHSL
jgi:hypothetical protein